MTYGPCQDPRYLYFSITMKGLRIVTLQSYLSVTEVQVHPLGSVGVSPVRNVSLSFRDTCGRRLNTHALRDRKRACCGRGTGVEETRGVVGHSTTNRPRKV